MSRRQVQEDHHKEEFSHCYPDHYGKVHSPQSICILVKNIYMLAKKLIILVFSIVRDLLIY